MPAKPGGHKSCPERALCPRGTFDTLQSRATVRWCGRLQLLNTDLSVLCSEMPHRRSVGDDGPIVSKHSASRERAAVIPIFPSTALASCSRSQRREAQKVRPGSPVPSTGVRKEVVVQSLDHHAPDTMCMLVQTAGAQHPFRIPLDLVVTMSPLAQLHDNPPHPQSSAQWLPRREALVSPAPPQPQAQPQRISGRQLVAATSIVYAGCNVRAADSAGRG